MNRSARAGSPFVGRQREMAELRLALEDAMTGRGRLVMRVGEPGKLVKDPELAQYVAEPRT